MTACGGGTIAYMWVLGQQYNQIGGFLIDDYTGNLTAIPGSPFTTQGSVPVSIVVKPGGRFVYVINQGIGGGPNGRGTGASVALFSVGGEGSLSFQQAYQTQGYVSQWAQMDSTGSYLYVLDKYSSSLNTTTGLYDGPNTDGNGAITAFSVDPNTGRLALVQNTTILNQNGTGLPYFEVGQSPFMMKTIGSCLLTINSADQSVSPYTSGTGGSLTLVTTNHIPLGTINATSITGTSSYVIITDGTANTVNKYTIGSGCTLAPTSGGVTTQSTSFPGSSYPAYSFIDSTSKYIYVLNGKTTSTLPTTTYSSITAYTINATNNELQPLVGAPFAVGSGPVCMVEDPTNQYLYVSNHNDGTITGELLDPNTGLLSDLKRGSTFTSVGQAGCLGLSGSVD